MHHKISLRASHRTLPLKALIELLGLGEPRIGRSVGLERVASDGRVLGVNRETFCTYDFPFSDDAPFEASLENAVLLIMDREAALEEILSGGGVAEIYVGLFLDGAESSGFTIPPLLARQIARLGLITTIEIYA